MPRFARPHATAAAPAAARSRANGEAGTGALDGPRLDGPGTLRAAWGLAAILLAPLAVAVLRLFDPLQPGASAAPWLPALAAGMVAAACAVAVLVSISRGLRHASPALMLRAAALGSLAIGLAVAAFRGASMPDAFPDLALGLGSVVAAGLLVIGGLAPGSMSTGRPWVALSLGALFVLLEGVLAASLFLAPPPAATTWLLVAAAALAAISTVPGPWLPAGMTAAGLIALAASRTGSVETLAGLLALAAGATAYATTDGGVRREVTTGVGAHPVPPPAPLPLEQADAVDPASARAKDEAAFAAEAGAEAARLARELRGTIAELLQARRTVELQRDEILRLETQDPLTGLATRRAILDRLRIEAGEARRYAHPVAVLLLDIDGFAALNRDHGTGVGDEVLREVALRLRLRMRAADALGRVGADSFMVLLPHTDEQGAATFAEALLERLLSRPFETYDGELRVAVSIGVAFMRPGMDLTDELLLAEADAALASARAAGGNRIAFDRLHGLLRLDERRRPAPPDANPQRGADGTR